MPPLFFHAALVCYFLLQSTLLYGIMAAGPSHSVAVEPVVTPFLILSSFSPAPSNSRRFLKSFLLPNVPKFLPSRINVKPVLPFNVIQYAITFTLRKFSLKWTNGLLSGAVLLPRLPWPGWRRPRIRQPAPAGKGILAARRLWYTPWIHLPSKLQLFRAMHRPVSYQAQNQIRI